MDKKSNRYRFWALLLNPIMLAIYGFGCYYAYTLCRIGGVRRRVPVIILCASIIFIWFIVCLILNIRKKKYLKVLDQVASLENGSLDIKQMICKIWCIMGILIFVVMTGVTGFGIYHTGVKYNGKLSWIIEDLKNKRMIKFTHNNIYEDGIDGILRDIAQAETLPEDLYISRDFSLDFSSDGTILTFDTYLYGKNKDGETKSFLISYDRNKSEKITVYLNGVVTDSYDDSKSLKPLVKMMEVIQLKDTVAKWDENKYTIFYQGVHNWGYNMDGIVYIDKDGDAIQLGSGENEIEGFTVSVYASGKEETSIPLRYIATWEEVPASFGAEVETENDNIGLDGRLDGATNSSSSSVGNTYTTDDMGNMTFYLNDTKGYCLSIVDAACGSRFYSLSESTDGGNTWKMLNRDPLLGGSGVVAGLCFIDEKLGFISLSHSGGSYGELYRTEDGGATFELVEIPVLLVPLSGSETYNPFDFPDVPTKAEDMLQLLVAQGQDGDYNHGSKALYQSENDGVTWEYVKEVVEEK